MIKQKIAGCVAWKRNIKGYTFDFLKLPSGYITAKAPTGDNEADKKMFDRLVYFNQRLYNGTNEKEIIKNITKFIKNYGRTN